MIQIMGNSDVKRGILGLFAGFVEAWKSEVPALQFMPFSLL